MLKVFKIFFIVIIFTVNFPSLGQSRTFKNVKDYSVWMMNYYKDPEPQYLIEAFKYGTRNKAIAKAASRNTLIGFFASCLREDTILQQQFFTQFEKTNDKDFIYGYGLTLWQIHTPYSLKSLRRFQNLEQLKIYKTDFEKLNNTKFTDLWNDSIVSPQHLDLLWADFFATGNHKSVAKIITKLRDLDSEDYYAKITAESAKWSLISNAINHQKVLLICKAELENTDIDTKKILEEIILKAAQN